VHTISATAHVLLYMIGMFRQSNERYQFHAHASHTMFCERSVLWPEILRSTWPPTRPCMGGSSESMSHQEAVNLPVVPFKYLDQPTSDGAKISLRLRDCSKNVSKRPSTIPHCNSWSLFFSWGPPRDVAYHYGSVGSLRNLEDDGVFGKRFISLQSPDDICKHVVCQSRYGTIYGRCWCITLNKRKRSTLRDFLSFECSVYRLVACFGSKRKIFCADQRVSGWEASYVLND
jgi:hypothetical protein